MNESYIYVCVYIYIIVHNTIKSKFVQMLTEAATMWHNSATFNLVVATAALNCDFKLQKYLLYQIKINTDWKYLQN